MKSVIEDLRRVNGGRSAGKQISNREATEFDALK